ncbi:hypothetical protein C667_08393, partial [Thauera phenylacetica B4P]
AAAERAAEDFAQAAHAIRRGAATAAPEHTAEEVAQSATHAATRAAAGRAPAEEAAEHVSDAAGTHGVVEAGAALLAHALLKDLAEDVSEVHGGLPFMV